MSVACGFAAYNRRWSEVTGWAAGIALFFAFFAWHVGQVKAQLAGTEVAASAVNRFFGLPMIRAQVFQDQSWLDGAPALVLDYSRTSRVYAQYRDEIRQVAPGLFLGLMYARTTPQPTLRMYFALESQP